MSKFKNDRTNGWVQVLLSLLLVIVPGIMLWVFLSGDWQNNLPLKYWEILLVAISFVLYTFLITWILILVNIVWYDMFNFTLPIAIILMGILLTYPIPTWARAIITLSLVFLAWPINAFTTWYTERKMSN